MSLGATITGRLLDYSPSRKPIVPSIEREKPITFDGNPERLSDESQDDRPDRHAFAKSRPSSANTCTSDTDENDYETSSEGPSRLQEGKTCHTHFLSKSHSGNLRKEEVVEGTSKVSEGFGTEEKMDFRQYAHVRKDVSDIAMSTISLPILRSIESSPTTEVKDRMISDSSFARQQKLRMIVEQTELLLSAESKIAESVKPEVCYLEKKYELNRQESLMLLPVIQNIELTEKDQMKESVLKMTENTENPIDRIVYSDKRQDHHSNDLIDIVENPESSKTSLYIPPYQVNDSRLENKSFDLFNQKRRVINDTDVLLKIHGEFSPLRCELREIAAKFRALKLQRISNTIDENKVTGGYSIGDRVDIDRCLVGNKKEQFSPMTMVGKSKSRESCYRYSTGTSKFFVETETETGFHGTDRSYNEPKKKDPMYFEITPSKKECSSIGNEYLGEKISNYYSHNQINSQFERFYYRPGSSCIRDRCQREKGIVRSTDDEEKGSLYYDTDFISRKSYDMNGSQYISRANADEPSDILILGRSKEVVKDHTTTERQRSKKDLRGSSMSSAIVTPNLIDENVLSGDKESFSNISLCKKTQDFPLNLPIPYSKKERSISLIENVEFINENTPKDFIIVRDSKLHLNEQRQKREEKTMAIDQSSQTSNIRTNESLTSTRRSKVIGLPKSIEKVKIVPVFFTTGIPKPLFPFFQLEDSGFSLNSKEKLSRQHMLTLKKRNSRKIFNCLSEKRHPLESDLSGSYVTDPPTLQRDYLSENERWRSNNVSKISSISPSCSSKKTTSSNAFKYASALGSICSGVARVTVSGSTISNQQKRFTQIREITTEKGIRGMRSSPEDFLSDT
ncbi:hypothetical protein M0804_006818 [Polistes exclamans]|nr:hypothetical protein M0804_006818 [Polistes exclamans]